jgi:hypothetical protein
MLVQVQRLQVLVLPVQLARVQLVAMLLERM